MQGKDLLLSAQVGWRTTQQLHLKSAGSESNVLRMHAHDKSVSTAGWLPCECWTQGKAKYHYLPSLFGPCQQLRAMRTKGLARRSPGPLCAGTLSSGTVLSTHKSSFLYAADFSSPDFSVKNMDRLLIQQQMNHSCGHPVPTSSLTIHLVKRQQIYSLP